MSAVWISLKDFRISLRQFIANLNTENIEVLDKNLKPYKFQISNFESEKLVNYFKESFEWKNTIKNFNELKINASHKNDGPIRIVASRSHPSQELQAYLERIENALDIKGISFASWDVKTKMCNVTFNTSKISEKKIHVLLASKSILGSTT